MPDIGLRLNKDMLVMSAPLDAVLARQGFDLVKDGNYLALMEPEVFSDAFRMERAVGANCLVTPTRGITPAHLAHARMQEDGATIARNLCDAALEHKPQHLLAEIGPCGLPIDVTSKNSLKEHRAQYQRALEFFEGCEIDGVFLNGFERAEELAVALDAVASDEGLPVFTSVRITDEGALMRGSASLEDAARTAQEHGAASFGFETALDSDAAAALAARARKACDLPLLVQLFVKERDPRRPEPLPENPYCNPDTMVAASAKLYAQGVELLRATGEATPAYTGAIGATVAGLDVRR